MTWQVPGNGYSFNDEFDAPTLDAKWTASGTYASYSCNTPVKSGLNVYHSGNQWSWFVQNYAVSNSTAVSFSMCFSEMFHQAYGSTALYVTNNATPGVGDGITVYTNYNYGSHSLHSGLGTGGSWSYGGYGINNIQNHYRGILHLQRDASDNWGAWWSADELTWVRAFSIAKSFGITHIAFSTNVNGGSTPQWVSLDWFRKDWITL